MMPAPRRTLAALGANPQGVEGEDPDASQGALSAVGVIEGSAKEQKRAEHEGVGVHSPGLPRAGWLGWFRGRAG